jgi:hypothetical protein
MSQVLQALKAELYNCRGGHLPALQKGVETLDAEAQRLLLQVVRDLKQDADTEKRKRRQGICW